MCGLGVIVGREPVRARDGWEIVETIRHRGPDGAGVVAFADDREPEVSRSPLGSSGHGRVVLAHVRLAILDLSDAGFQPMTDESGTVWVVFNGEIFNFRKLRRELRARGHRFRSDTDTEVLVHGWDEWRLGLLDRIEGMFAACLHDTRTNETVLVRDRLGIKPLYWGRRPDGAFVAASEIKALFAVGVVPKVDPAGLDAFLSWRYVPDPDTAFSGIKKVPPGHLLRVSQDGEVASEQYWDFHYRPSSDNGPGQAARVREALSAAVTRQLVADVPVGAFFSGGIDSTSIVEFMRRELAPAQPTCFTVGFSARDLAHDIVPDDIRFARAYAAERPIDYRESILEPDLVDSLPRIIWHLDEPIADPAALSAYYICSAAQSSFKVLLSGMGGDELFGGYPRYRATAIARHIRRLPSPLRSALKHAAFQFPGAGATRVARVGRNAQKLIGNACTPFPGDYLGMLCHFDRESRHALYTSELRAAMPEGDRAGPHFVEHLERPSDDDWLHRAMYLDLKTFLPALNLTYMDKMSMAHSIEVRVPLIDELVVDVVRALPANSKLTLRDSKIALKQAMRGTVPGEIIDRPKAGFGAPVRGWIVHELGPLIDDLLSVETLRKRGFFEPSEVARLVADFRSGRRDTALQIWQLLTFEIWQQVFIDRRVQTGADLEGTRVLPKAAASLLLRSDQPAGAESPLHRGRRPAFRQPRTHR
jgi:asparagine synthase (glutamine-hydrolysing)